MSPKGRARRKELCEPSSMAKSPEVPATWSIRALRNPMSRPHRYCRAVTAQIRRARLDARGNPTQHDRQIGAPRRRSDFDGAESRGVKLVSTEGLEPSTPGANQFVETNPVCRVNCRDRLRHSQVLAGAATKSLRTRNSGGCGSPDCDATRPFRARSGPACLCAGARSERLHRGNTIVKVKRRPNPSGPVGVESSQ